MAIIDNRTPNRDYLLPHQDNDLQDDVARLRVAFTSIDADVAGLLTSVSQRALLVHSHSFADIPGLQAALDGKSNTGHTHPLGALSDVSVAGATAGQFLKRIASGWIPANIAIVDVGNLQSALDAERPISNITGLVDALAGKVALKGSAIVVPRGTTANRPAGTGTESLIRYNTTTQSFEGWSGTGWGKIGGGAPTGSAPPSPAQDGDLWWSRDLGILFIYYDDGDSAQWVSTNIGADPALMLLRANNLSELASADAALTNLGGNVNGRDIFKNASALGATLAKIVDAVAGRAALGAPPTPQVAAGIGQFTTIAATAGNPLVLPAGGTWAWWRIPRDVATNGFAGGIAAGVDAGGTTISAGNSAVIFYGVCQRIA